MKITNYDSLECSVCDIISDGGNGMDARDTMTMDQVNKLAREGGHKSFKDMVNSITRDFEENNEENFED